MGAIEAYLILEHSKSFELPKVNQIWQRGETKKVLKNCGLTYESEVALCQTGVTNTSGVPVGKRLKFFSTSPCFAHLLTRRYLGSAIVPHMQNLGPSTGAKQAIKI